MHLSTELLQTFLEIYTQGSFTKAAKVLGLSQSAISQKIGRLEELLQATVFIRRSDGLDLTSAGQKLLVFAKQQVQMEQEFIQAFNQYSDSLAGVFRLGGYSSVVRSVLIPALAPLLRKHKGIDLQFSSHEMIDLLDVLKSNRADAVIVDFMPSVVGLETEVLGEEEYVMIESSKHKDIPNTYLDHGPHDNATDSFFKFQGKDIQYRRGFMGDVYGILDGVAQGLGRAVMSRHLIKNDKRFRVVKYPKRYVRPVVLCYYKQSYYLPLHTKVTESLIQGSAQYL